MKHTLATHPLFPSNKALARDDMALNCPFQAPVVINDQRFNQQKIVPVACGDWCALFERHNNVVKLNCSTPNNFSVLVTEEKKLAVL